MVKQRGAQTFLKILTICLCLGSLAILSIFNVGSMPLILEAVTENDAFDQSESDDEFAITATLGEMAAGLIFLNSRTSNLDFPALRLAPDSPPPKYA